MKIVRWIGFRIALVTLLASSATYTFATAPPRPGTDWSPSLTDQRLQQLQFKRALTESARQARMNRQRVSRGEMTASAAAAAPFGMVISGSRSIPVLTGVYANTGSAPYPVANLQQELFDGPWPTGTMKEFYAEISRNQLVVDGTVIDWVTVANNDTHYEGAAGCNGLCNSAKLGDYLKEVLDQVDGAVNFGQYDNDGPDGVPNSGDDDGFVDFVAFVHPEAGGECGNSNVWSHRWVYSGWSGSEYSTNDNIQGTTTKIRVDDYVIQPALACDGSTMIEIGVFAHEFGHAFGLPDLYDTDGSSSGIGSWGLMAGGSWGGDGQSPERPSHMSAWSKEFLGWVTPATVTSDLPQEQISNAEFVDDTYKMPINADQYYLVENRQQTGFDDSLVASGLAIWKINDTVINSGLGSNRVNADENNRGVELIEGDNNSSLNGNTRQQPGDLFVSGGFANPRSMGNNAVCNIGAAGNVMTADLKVQSGLCTGQASRSLTLSLNPADRLGNGDSATLVATLTAGGTPVAGASVSFVSADGSLASVSPATAVTDSAGLAQTTVRGESTWNNETQVTATAGAISETVTVRVPLFDRAWLAGLLAAFVALAFGLRRRQSRQRS